MISLNAQPNLLAMFSLGAGEIVFLLGMILLVSVMARVIALAVRVIWPKVGNTPPTGPQSPSSGCPKCGAPLPSDAPEGLCPRCLVAMNLATQTEVSGETGPAATAAAKPAPPLPAADVAKLFPQLEIIECLGRGGMGAVYKARQPRLDRVVALKILSPEKQGNQQFAERFEREARALARLHHPNIVTIYDFGETQGNFYLLMEFVDGLTLRQLLQTRKLAPPEALAIVPKICEALQYAHEQGIVHRDIKPENILMARDGRVKIADFGIAKIIGDGERGNLTEAQAIGTPHYMSPEQIEHPRAVDHRADIYSLGVVFYEMLTGELPLGKFPPPSKKVQIDVRLDEIVLRALEKEPKRRYQQASEVKTQVETVAATSGTRGSRDEDVEAESPDRREKARALQHLLIGTLLPETPFSKTIAWGWLVIFGAYLFLLLNDHFLGVNHGIWRCWEWCFFAFVAIGVVELLFRIGLARKAKTARELRLVNKGIFKAFLFGGLVAAALALYFGFFANRILWAQGRSIKSDYIGQTWFPLGDSIQITSVDRTTNLMTVRGHYHLVSHKIASLALDVTAASRNIHGGSGESRPIARGSGDFDLAYFPPVAGLPHVSMYGTDSHCFASVYFGTKAEAAAESKARWITNDVLHQAELQKVTIIGLYRTDSPELPKWAAEFFARYPGSGNDFVIAIKEWIPGVQNQLRVFRKHAGNEFLLSAPLHPDVRVYLTALDQTAGDGSFQAFGAQIQPGDLVKLVPGLSYHIQPINVSDVYRWTVAPGVSIVPETKGETPEAGTNQHPTSGISRPQTISIRPPTGPTNLNSNL